MKPQRNATATVNFKTLNDWLVNHSRVLAGQVSFGATMSNNAPDRNIKCWKATGTSPAAPNTDFTVAHGLGYTPATIMGQDTTNGGVLYRSPVTAWNATTVTLRCTTALANYNIVLA